MSYLDRIKRMTPVQRLAYWATEREAIRLHRVQGHPPPWTADPILSTYRFCNVRRMDDAVSKWLMDNWYQPYHGHRNMLYAVGLARYFNEPDTLTWLTNWVFTEKGDVNWWKVEKEIKARRANGHRVFNPAYIVSTNGRKMDKVDAAVGYARGLEQVAGTLPARTHSMEDTHRELMVCDGVASFMAGQIVADLRWAVPGTWTDRHEWAPMGPGSARGLARLVYARDEWESVAKSYGGKSVRKDGVGAWPWDFREHVLGKLPKLLPREVTNRLEAHDYQNCLCEYDKYERVLWGEGKPKQLYRVQP